MPGSVRAARLHRHGEPLVIEDVELREPSGNEVRVELEFGGVNPVDTYVAAGRVNPDGPLPRTLGAEASGVIDGRSVLVAGEGLGVVRDGVWARAAIVPEQALTPVPEGVQSRDAAVMGGAGLTAVNVVRELARVTAEDRVLVLGAAGGVGTMIVSLAHAAGATVWGQTGTERKTAAIIEQGADRAIVASPDELGEQITQFGPTVVFDPLGGLRGSGYRRDRGTGQGRLVRHLRRNGSHLQHAAAVSEDDLVARLRRTAAPPRRTTSRARACAAGAG